jgi:hypothetical protein
MYKVFCVIAGVALFLPLWVLAQPSPGSAAGTLAEMRGKSRPLLIFYPQYPGDPSLGRMVVRQRTSIDGHREELRDRDVVAIYVPIPADDAALQSKDFLGGLRTQFHIEGQEFTVVLLGKDGGEKFRSHTPVTIEKLDALIDAMPMRQQEMRDGHHTE